MGILTSLKFVSAQRINSASPLVKRRQKMLIKLYDQIELAKAQAAGGTYAPTKIKRVLDNETGEKRDIPVSKRVKPWWWTDGTTGKVNLTVRYGNKGIELKKGTNAIELDNATKILETLELVKKAIEGGEMDTAIETASKAVRANFK